MEKCLKLQNIIMDGVSKAKPWKTEKRKTLAKNVKVYGILALGGFSDLGVFLMCMF